MGTAQRGVWSHVAWIGPSKVFVTNNHHDKPSHRQDMAYDYHIFALSFSSSESLAFILFLRDAYITLPPPSNNSHTYPRSSPCRS